MFETADLQPRKLPVSDVLLERQEQITQLIQHWEPTLEEQILAENFYLDRSREKRMAAIQEVLEKAGPVKAVGDMHPINQLRGRYTLQTENGKVNIFFTLTPEKYPKVQRLDVSFEPNEPDA